MPIISRTLVFGLLIIVASTRATEIETDLLIVGGNESGCAAAVQAARLGVKKIVLTNDIQWLGGQFSAEAVGVVDEWTTVRGKRTHFPRSGLFAEMLQRMRASNCHKYGLPNPSNAVCGSETIEPAEAAKLFDDLVGDYPGQIQVLRPWQPATVLTQADKVTGVTFEHPEDPAKKLTVRAKMTIDCSDWGDVVRLSGAAYAAGVDLKSRFQEPSAPVTAEGSARNEMNPISWCVVVREAGKMAPIPAPPTYQPRSFAALDKTVPWVDSAYPEGIYSITNQSVYTHRRLVDRWHNGLAVGTEKVLLNWPVQDYPLFDFPKPVAEALEATEPGASTKNIVNMTPAQRRIVFADAKQHSLGFLHHLQSAVHDRVGDFPQSLRRMELTGEFGTPDRLPPKPYVREGLRLEALYMLREQDIRAKDRQPRWAQAMVPDGVFGFQFNID
ncbi:MAG: FAD-dependent oxidoreductase, partial [Prosthecobacter sp.]|nr:FAD-dependent oxidoreductase [Prosthecobacter sp.]